MDKVFFSKFANDHLDEIKKDSENVRNESVAALGTDSIVEYETFLGTIFWSIEKINKSGPLKSQDDKKLLNALNLILSLTKGSQDVFEQILTGKYVLVSAALKQEMEIVAQVSAIFKNEEGAEGKVVNIRHYPGEGMGRVYGLINDVAHIVKPNVIFEFMAVNDHEGKTARISASPHFKKQSCWTLFSLHYSNLSQMAELIVNFATNKGMISQEEADGCMTVVVSSFRSLAMRMVENLGLLEKTKDSNQHTYQPSADK